MDSHSGWRLKQFSKLQGTRFWLGAGDFNRQPLWCLFLEF
jgi:hypothetical protein